MTYQQIEETMGNRERAAVLIMCMCKINDEGRFEVNSIRNKILYRIAKIVLGSDPLDRIGLYRLRLDDELCQETVPEIMAELYALKQAWK